MKTILNTLKCTYTQYDNFRDRKFATWCAIISSKYHYSYRFLTKQEGLRNWYQDMWLLHVEKPFLKENKDYLNACLMDADTASMLLSNYSEEIEKMEPLPLLKLIMKNCKNEQTHH